MAPLASRWCHPDALISRAVLAWTNQEPLASAASLASHSGASLSLDSNLCWATTYLPHPLPPRTQPSQEAALREAWFQHCRESLYPLPAVAPPWPPTAPKPGPVEAGPEEIQEAKDRRGHISTPSSLPRPHPHLSAESREPHLLPQATCRSSNQVTRDTVPLLEAWGEAQEPHPLSFLGQQQEGAPSVDRALLPFTLSSAHTSSPVPAALSGERQGPGMGPFIPLGHNWLPLVLRPGYAQSASDQEPSWRN